MSQIFEHKIILQDFRYHAYQLMLSQEKYMKLAFIEDIKAQQTVSTLRILHTAQNQLIP